MKTSKRAIVGVGFGLALLLAIAAQGQSPPGRGPMWHHRGAAGGAMMGAGGPGMGMGCPMLLPGVAIAVGKLDDGVTITLTSSDPKIVSRLQKRAEIMRLVHELQQEEQADGG
jgi:hypothetical protein